MQTLITIIGFDVHSSFSLSDGSGFGRNVLIFGKDNSSLAQVHNKKYISILGKSPGCGLDDTMLITDTEYSIDFTKFKNTFCLSLHCNSCII